MATENGISYQQAYYAYQQGRLKGVTKKGSSLEVDPKKAYLETSSKKTQQGEPQQAKPSRSTRLGRVPKVHSQEALLVLEHSDFHTLQDNHLEFLEEVEERNYHCLPQPTLEVEHSFGTLDLEPYCADCPFNADNLKDNLVSCEAPGIRKTDSSELIICQDAVDQAKELIATKEAHRLVSLISTHTTDSEDSQQKANPKALTLFLTTVHNNLHLKKLTDSTDTIQQELESLKKQVTKLTGLEQSISTLQVAFKELKESLTKPSGDGVLNVLDEPWQSSSLRATPLKNRSKATPVGKALSTGKTVGRNNTLKHSHSIILGTGLSSTRDLQLLVGDAAHNFEIPITVQEYQFLVKLLTKAINEA